MTGTRVSAVFKPEKEFGVVESGAWHRFPSNLTFRYQPNNNIREYYGIGSKFVDNAVAGMFSGTWEAGFKLDYNLINILGIAFEDYSYDSSTMTHTFGKANGKRVPSMSVCIKKLNEVVGGSKDQTIILKGCVCKSISISQSNGSATLDCRLSGQYINEESSFESLDSTDWEEYYDNEDAVPVEWACMTIDGTQVANTESVSFSVDNGLQLMPGCGSRFYSNYDEGQSVINLSTSCYSHNPEDYYQKVYSGGYNSTETAPKSKGLRPIPSMSIRSAYDMNDDNTSEYSLTLDCERVWVSSMGQYSFDANSKIMDSPSFKVRRFALKLKNTTGRVTIWE